MRNLTAMTGAVFLLLAATACADELKLVRGGDLKGTAERLVFLLNGKETAYTRAQVTTVWLSQTAKDTLVLADGGEVKGELILLSFRTPAGLIVLQRPELAGVTLTVDPLAAARKEFLARKETVAPTDGPGLWELAEWCMGKGLKTDAIALARAAIEVDPAGAFAEKAHKLLGHVQYENEWMTPRELLERRKKARGSEETPAEPGPKVEEPATPAGDAKLTPEQVTALKEALAKNDELYRTYSAKAHEAKKSDVDAVRGKYSAQWSQLIGKIDVLRKKIQIKETARTTTSYGTSVTTTTVVSPQVLEKEKEELSALCVQRLGLAETIKAALAEVSKTAAVRMDRVTLVRDRNKRILLLGKPLDAGQMTSNYESLFKEPGAGSAAP